MSRLTRDGIAEPVSRDQILRHERGQGNIHFSCSADHVLDWQPYPVDPYSCYMCDYTQHKKNKIKHIIYLVVRIEIRLYVRLKRQRADIILKKR